MPLHKLLILFTFIFQAQARTPALLYSKEDLRILHENRQHNEFLAHAKDLRPTERDELWSQQVLEMSLLFIDQVISERNFKEITYREVQRLQGLGKNNSNEIFLFKRKDYMVNYLENCFREQKSFCQKKALDILETTPLQRELADIPTSIGLEVLKSGTLRINQLIPFFKFGFISERSQFLCRKKIVRDFIFDWYKEFNSQSRADKEIKLFTADNFHPNCIESVLNFYVADFNNINSPIDREQIIHWLQKIGYLKESEINTLLTIYLLKSPVNGDVFNTAWNKMKELGENYSKREIILKKLKTLDPLPDNIFGLSDPLREKTLFSLIAKNIPEYIDYYSQTCIDYHLGNKVYPNGNPTINCKEFYRLYRQRFGDKHPRTKKLEKSISL